MLDRLRTLQCSAWLGWQIESNWTDPALFALYLLVKPLTGSLLLVCMFWAARSVTSGAVSAEYLPFLYVGNACYMLVGSVMFGTSSAVLADRENYGMLKYIRLCPIRLQTYVIGRGIARGLEAAAGAVLSVVAGLILLPELRAALAWEGIAWHWLAGYLAIGTVMLMALGVILAGAVLNMARHGMFFSEGVAGMLYLLSGAVFPIDRLPGSLQPISRVLPPTYWLEGMRRSLLGKSIDAGLGAWEHWQLSLALSATTVVLCLIAHLFFRWCERRAWRLGRFDQTTGM